MAIVAGRSMGSPFALIWAARASPFLSTERGRSCRARVGEMAQLGRGSCVKLLHLPPLALDAKDTVYFRQLTRGARVGMPQSLTTVHQRQFAGDIPANLMHCADSPELPGVMDKGRVRVETRIDPAPPAS